MANNELIEKIVQAAVAEITATEGKKADAPKDEKKEEKPEPKDEKPPAAPEKPEQEATTEIDEAALKALVKKYVAENSPSVGAPTGGGESLTMSQIKGMSKEQINATWDQIKEVLANQKA